MLRSLIKSKVLNECSRSVYPEYKDSPHHVEKLQDYQEAVEDVVGGEHVDVGLRGVDGGVQDTGGEKVAPLQHFEMMFIPFLTPSGAHQGVTIFVKFTL